MAAGRQAVPLFVIKAFSVAVRLTRDLRPHTVPGVREAFVPLASANKKSERGVAIIALL